MVFQHGKARQVTQWSMTAVIASQGVPWLFACSEWLGFQFGFQLELPSFWIRFNHLILPKISNVCTTEGVAWTKVPIPMNGATWHMWKRRLPPILENLTCQDCHFYRDSIILERFLGFVSRNGGSKHPARGFWRCHPKDRLHRFTEGFGRSLWGWLGPILCSAASLEMTTWWPPGA
jgi:hypothetical protein